MLHWQHHWCSNKIYISGYVRPTGCLRCVCLISHHEKFGSTISLQTHHKSQSFESRTNTNGLCSTSTLTWVNINSKYFGCMPKSAFWIGAQFWIWRVEKLAYFCRSAGHLHGEVVKRMSRHASISSGVSTLGWGMTPNSSYEHPNPVVGPPGEPRYLMFHGSISSFLKIKLLMPWSRRHRQPCSASSISTKS